MFRLPLQGGFYSDLPGCGAFWNYDRRPVQVCKPRQMPLFDRRVRNYPFVSRYFSFGNKAEAETFIEH